MIKPQQVSRIGSSIYPYQAGMIPMTSTAETSGIDISSLMGLMMPMMIVMMMMGMMGKMMAASG